MQQNSLSKFCRKSIPSTRGSNRKGSVADASTCLQLNEVTALCVHCRTLHAVRIVLAKGVSGLQYMPVSAE